MCFIINITFYFGLLYFCSDVLDHVESKKLKPVEQMKASPPPSSTAPAQAHITPRPVVAPITTSAPAIENIHSADLEVSNMRRTIAKRLTQSKVIFSLPFKPLVLILFLIYN